MKNLYKKISAIMLSGIVVCGGIAVSGVNSFASSSQSMIERSFIARYRGFIGNSPEFMKVYEPLAEEVSDEVANDYKRVMEKIYNAVKKLKVKYYFNLDYMGVPDDIPDKIRQFREINYSSGCFSSVDSVINMLYRNKVLHRQNYLIRFRDNGKVYSFIFYVR